MYAIIAFHGVGSWLHIVEFDEDICPTWDANGFHLQRGIRLDNISCVGSFSHKLLYHFYQWV